MVRMRPDLQCFNPRDYQVELLDKASKKNTIVQLGTGSGKTFIAVLLLKEYGVQMFAPLDQGGKRAFFIVEKVNLVEQQAKHIEVHTSFKVGQVHGQTSSELWKSPVACEKFMKENHVVVITAQCLLDFINHAFIKIQDTCVLIFDECHHALGSKHPYRLIMTKYKELKKAGEPVPRVLGLTASLIKEKVAPEKLSEQLVKLESVLDSVIETASDLVSLTKYGAKPYEAIVLCRDFETDKLGVPNYDKIMNLLYETDKFIRETTLFHPDLDMDPRSYAREALKATKSVFQQLGPWAAWKISQMFEKDLMKHINLQQLPEKATLFLNLAKTTIITVKRLLEPEMRQIKSLNELERYVPHRIIRLFQVFEMFNPDFQKQRMALEKTEHLSAIIFVNQRYIAYSLHIMMRAIRQWEPKFKFLNTDFVVGASGPNMANSNNQGLQKRQTDALRKFHRGDLNVLIATSVLEEGVDVKQCNVVIKFDRPTDMRSYVQSKGRARKAGSRYVVLVDQKDTSACDSDLKDFQQIEKILLSRHRTVNNPTEDDSLTDLGDVDDLMAPYVVEKTGATIKMSNAIALVNRYCAKLPSDIFTRLVPNSTIIPVEDHGVTKYCAELLLPINSPIKHAIILKDPMPNKKAAQMAVALEACRQLHLKGELDDNLLPKGRESIAKLLEQMDDEPDEYAPGMAAKVGSSKRKQLYDKKIARALNESHVEPEKECYIYALELERLRDSEPSPNTRRRRFEDPKEYEYCFGFLSTKEIPKIPPFPLFLRQGNMKVRLTLAPQKTTVTKEQLEEIQYFHNYLFTQVLQMCKTGNLEFDVTANAPLNTLIVPLNKSKEEGYSINMKYVSGVVANMENMPRVPTDEVRRKFKFDPENYKDAVVMPWYRNMEQPAFYYVAEILTDLRPSSQFPDHNFTTFNEYFIKKYNLEIYDQEQSLLDVDFTSNRLNLLLPRIQSQARRARSFSGSSTSSAPPTPSESRESGPHPSQRQILIPELMDVHPISATLWNVIAALPSIFYRINQLLLSDELRETILVKAFGKGSEETKLKDSFEWSCMTYTATYEEKQSVIVKKIQQLRDLNQKKLDAQQEKEKKEETKTDGEEWTIGVWDPEDAVRSGVDVDMFNNKENMDGEDQETVGLSQGLHDGNISDEDDDLPFVMHDYTARLNSHNLNGNGNGIQQASWEDTVEIVPSGWGDLDGVGEVDAIPFQIIGGSGGLNVQALMEDVGRVFDPKTPEKSDPAVPSATTTAASASSTSTASSTVSKLTKEELQRKKIQEEMLAKAQERLEALEISEEKEKPRRLEETVDLDEFGDDLPLEEEENQIARAKTMDEEIEELKRGALEKHKIDNDTVKTDASSREKCEVLPIAAQDLQPRPFSFEKESQTMHGRLLKERDQEAISHVDSDVGMGVSPCLLLTALTTSNAADGMSLERFETIGDSFLKFATTDYLYHTLQDQHEGKLSFARSKEVSNCNLYRLGKKLGIPQLIIANKFDAHDSWLPPCYIPTCNFKAPNTDDAEEKDIEMERLLNGETIEEKPQNKTGWDMELKDEAKTTTEKIETITFPKRTALVNEDISPLPYNLLTQQNISDKSIADAMEALIGVHLLTLGPNPTLKVMSWMGLKVIQKDAVTDVAAPLLRFIDTPTNPNASTIQLDNLWQQFQFAKLEEKIGYRFKERAYLVQAFTHASYSNNRVTGCYQRLEFLGDAVLDYMITRFLFEDVRQYSPGVLTDLRSALVNNTIFASLAVKYEFQKHFIAMCPGLHHMIEKFVQLCADRNFDTNFNAEMYMVTTEEEIDEGHEEDVEVPKALGDVFESVAGAIYLDSGRNLDTTWQVLFHMMRSTIESCCANPPRSPIRELMELESSKARFSKMERILETGKVRVTVDVGNNMRFTGMGRNYRIAKATAAKRALRYLHMIEVQRRQSPSDSPTQ
ncbi:CBN-DCR-1 protein [Caenorhabditis brenneri]|uniref:CBN-DCR-1 protein n=1 Tax=Caenorhabditis brenneri TaxID=135651 RepID=G0N0F3_CAEBE|nr:CBN-DCR-1 protein [Caenorhabditis brenneri]